MQIKQQNNVLIEDNYRVKLGWFLLDISWLESFSLRPDDLNLEIISKINI